MYSWMNPKLELRAGGIAGNGIFAREEISKDERLVVFGGRIMTLDEERALPSSIKDYAHQIDDDLVIGICSETDIQPADNINHSCDPNAGFKGQITLVSMRTISSGEEVTFDYAMTLSDVNGDCHAEGLRCLCRSAHCRQYIRGSDWRIKQLQTRYAGFFQPYLAEKIMAIPVSKPLSPVR